MTKPPSPVPKSPAERKREEYARRKKEGKVLFKMWVWPHMIFKLHNYADKLLRRGKE